MNFRNFFLGLVCVGGLLLVSCTDDDPAVTFHETCADVQVAVLDETGDRPVNGTYTLYIEGDETKPWDAYCHDMNRSRPKEFITVNESDNYSQFSGTIEITETKYRRYRIDPVSLKIDPLDDTFATTTGEILFLPDEREHIPAGWAQFGDGSVFGNDTARAKIDLTDTPFVFADSVATNFFCTEAAAGGNSSSSGFTLLSNLSSVTLTARNTDPSFYVKTVADCANLSGMDQMGTEDFTKGAWPLQYVGISQ